MKNLISLLTIILLFVPAAFAESLSGHQLELDFGAGFSQGPQLEDLKTTLKNTYGMIVNRNSSTMDRNQAIQSLFNKVDNLCLNNCDLVIGNLKSFNDQMQGQSPQVAMANIIKGITNKDPEAGDIERGLELMNYSDQLTRLYEQNPEEMRQRLMAALQAVRSVVNFEQLAIFKSMSSDQQEKNEGLTEIKKDLSYMIRQGAALKKILTVVQAHKGGQPWTKADATIIAEAVTDLGIFYIKLAQSVSNLSGVMPVEVTDALKMFQDNLPPMDPRVAEEVLTQELGRNPHDVFRNLDLSKPLSTGSIAVVYEAEVKDMFGRWHPVVVKVQRPGLKETLDYNRRLNRLLVDFSKVSSFSTSPILDFLTDQIIGLEDAFEGELDFKKEMRNSKRFARFFYFSRDIKVPNVYSEYTTKRVLVAEKASGKNFESVLKQVVDQYAEKDKALQKDMNIEALWGNQKQEALEQLAQKRVQIPEYASLEETYKALFEATSYMLFVTGEMHADLHPGNILAVLQQEENNVSIRQMVMLDYGQTVKTKGFIINPLMAGFHLLTGNAEGFTKRLIAMGKDPKFPEDKLLAVVKESFAKNNINRVRVASLVKSGVHLNTGEPLQKAMSEILKAAFKDLGYRGNPKYVQVVRSLAPIGSSLLLIGRNFEFKRVALLSLVGFARGVGLGTFQYLASILPNTFGDLKNTFDDAIANYKNDKQSRTNSGVQEKMEVIRCDQIFL